MPFPAGLTLVSVHGRVDSLPSGGASGQVCFTRPVALVGGADSSVVPPRPEYATLDAAGEFTISLPATNDPDWTPVDWAYTVDVVTNAGLIRGTLQLNYLTTSVELADLLQVDGTATTGTTYIALSARGIAGGVAGLDVDGDVNDADGNKILGGGATPSGTVAAGTSYGVSSTAGAATAYSRGDHSHGTPALGTTGTTAAAGNHAHSGVYDPAGTAAAAVSTHVGLADPHTQYALETSLSNVDNTSDANKPISAATQTALDAKAPLASPTFTGTVAGVTKAMVGLGSADNTSDVNKPVSMATQTALDAKVAITGGNGFTLGNGGVVVPAGASRMDFGFSDAAEGAGLELYKDDHATRPGAAAFVYGAGAPGVGAVQFINYDGVDYYPRVEYLPAGGVKVHDSVTPSTPSGGAVLFADTGELKCIDSGGVVSTVGGSALVVKRAVVSSGNITPQNTAGAWAPLTGGPTLVIPAVVGDYISVDIASLIITKVATTFYDLAVLNGASLARFGSSGNGTAATEGDGSLYHDTNFPRVGTIFDFVAEAGDINAGNITICVAVNSVSAAGTFHAGFYPFRWRVLNHGAATVS